MKHYIGPESFWRVRNLYCRLRMVRLYNQAARRRYYRHIKKEVRRLVAEGANPEHLRLYCRFLSNPTCTSALRRLEAFEAMLGELARVRNTKIG